MIYCILGQTASGKTSLAIEIAKLYNVPIISADAFQCFKMMQIGTDKPKKEDISNLTFHFTDEYEPNVDMSVYLFQQECRPILDNYVRQDRDVLVVGGTFLYIKALLYPFVFTKSTDTDKTKYYEQLSVTQLQELLLKRDKKTYNMIDINNPRRLIRALVNIDNGIDRESILSKNDGTPLYPVKFLMINVDVEEGNKKIDNRIDKMFEEGFVEEVKRLIQQYGTELRPFHCIGYDEIINAIQRDENPYDDRIKNLIKTHTHQYAKKQRSFLRNQFNDVYKGTKEEIKEYLMAMLESGRNNYGNI